MTLRVAGRHSSSSAGVRPRHRLAVVHAGCLLYASVRLPLSCPLTPLQPSRSGLRCCPRSPTCRRKATCSPSRLSPAARSAPSRRRVCQSACSSPRARRTRKPRRPRTASSSRTSSRPCVRPLLSRQNLTASVDLRFVTERQRVDFTYNGVIRSLRVTAVEYASGEHDIGIVTPATSMSVSTAKKARKRSARIRTDID